jgi:hypothetical protein
MIDLKREFEEKKFQIYVAASLREPPGYLRAMNRPKTLKV